MLTKGWQGSHERPGDSAGSGAVVGRRADFHRAGPLGLVARDREEFQASSISSRGFSGGRNVFHAGVPR